MADNGHFQKERTESSWKMAAAHSNLIITFNSDPHKLPFHNNPSRMSLAFLSLCQIFHNTFFLYINKTTEYVFYATGFPHIFM